MLGSALDAAFTDKNSLANVKYDIKIEKKKSAEEAREERASMIFEQSAETINTAFENLTETEKTEAEKMWNGDVETTNLTFKEQEETHEKGKEQVKLANEAEQIKQDVTQMLEGTNNTEPSRENVLASSFIALEKLKDDFPAVADVADILKSEITAEFEEMTKKTREGELKKRAEEVTNITHAETKEERDEAIEHVKTKVELASITLSEDQSIETQSPISEEARKALNSKTPKKKGRGTLGEVKDKADFKEELDKVVDETSSDPSAFRRIG